MIEKRIKQVYEQQEVEISSVEIETLANISCELSAVHIMEVYSPARFSKEASRFGLKPGFAIDLEEAKPDGSFWDLSRPEDVEAVNQLIDRDEPVLLTGSPPCDQFSHLQNINKYRVSPDQRKIRMDKALEHLLNSCSFYRKQLKAGRLFLHEAPWNATSWKDPEVKALTDRPDTYLVRGPMCRWEMMATDRRGLQGTGYVRKETGWLTNSRELAQLLEGECSNKAGKDPWHRHVHLIGGIAKQAARYPPALVKAVLRTVKAYLVQKGELNSMESNTSGPICEEPFVPADYRRVLGRCERRTSTSGRS